MQMAPRDDLEREYDNLTAKQQAIVDARVEHPNVPKTHISREYAPQIYNDKYADNDEDTIDEMNNSYVTQVLNGQNNELVPDIIRYKQDIKRNQRQEGTVSTQGDPFSALPDDDGEGWQTWDERPNKQAQERQESQQADSQGEGESHSQITLRAPVAAQVDDDAVHVLMDKQYFKSLLEGQSLPPELHKQLMSDLLSERLR